jgi:hypothetical protein
MAYTITDFGPDDLLTSQKETFRRLRVDVAQTGFFEGREFRSFIEFSIAQGQSQWIRVTAPIPFILFEQSLTLDAGSIRFSAFAGATGAGDYETPLPVIGKNRMPSRRAYDTVSGYYEPQITIATGGAATGGTLVEVFRVIAANSSAQQTTVGGVQATERGLPAGVYYLKLENISNSTATGVYSLFFEEGP